MLPVVSPALPELVAGLSDVVLRVHGWRMHRPFLFGFGQARLVLLLIVLVLVVVVSLRNRRR